MKITSKQIKLYCRDHGLNNNDAAFLDHLASFQNAGKHCYQSLKTLAYELDHSVSTVQRIIKRVGGCLRFRNSQSSNHYFLDFQVVKRNIPDGQKEHLLNKLSNSLNISKKVSIRDLVNKSLNKKTPEQDALVEYAESKGHSNSHARYHMTDFFKYWLKNEHKHPGLTTFNDWFVRFDHYMVSLA